jgi:hypothetical protein
MLRRGVTENGFGATGSHTVMTMARGVVYLGTDCQESRGGITSFCVTEAEVGCPMIKVAKQFGPWAQSLGKACAPPDGWVRF